ncbi:MAG TPA: DNA primase [Gammaproteobacteria bacterium]|nr:DNA primase [Gammaproteobacteria bacterium]
MAGRIPQSFIDELLARIDIVDVIDSRVPLKKAGREYKACCPFHSEKTPSFTVSQVKQFYHCFGCGQHGTAITFLMDYEHMDFVEAIEELAHQAGLEVPREAGSENVRTDSTQPLYKLLERVSAWYQEQLRTHEQAGRVVEYLKQRGLTGEVAARFHIGFAPAGWENLARALNADSATRKLLLDLGLTVKRDDGTGTYDRFRDRVMFPIHDRRGRTIAFGGRVLDNSTPKYMNSPESAVFHKGQELYGLFEARKAVRKLERILVVEGYMDVVALAQFDINYAVATLGTATTREHLEQLYRTVPEVVFCFDGDRAGREAAWRALENALPVLTDGREARFLFLPEGEDPDTLVRKTGKDGFEQCIASATHLSYFFFERLSAQLDLGSIDGRARLVAAARPLLATLPDGMFRQLMTERLAELAGTSPAALAGRLELPRETRENTPPPTRKGGTTGGHSPVRDAISILLYQPALAQQITELPFEEPVDVPGVALMRELLELLQRQPLASTGAILEHWRGRDEARHLARLAQWSPVSHDLNLLPDLLRCLQQIQRLHLEQRIEILDKKDKLHKLTEQERKEYWKLQTMLQEVR